MRLAQKEVEEVRDDGLRHWPDEDARAHIGYINATVQALDALGWRGIVVGGLVGEDAQAAPTDLEKREGEDR